MAILMGVLVLAAPLAVLVGLGALIDRRHARREEEILRQVAITDALHARLGAVVAPVVRRRARAWRVSVAVPAERPIVVAALLAAVEQALGGARYEIVLGRPAPRGPRPALLGRESLSWT
jgi:hypothetical protein